MFEPPNDRCLPLITLSRSTQQLCQSAGDCLTGFGDGADFALLYFFVLLSGVKQDWVARVK